MKKCKNVCNLPFIDIVVEKLTDAGNYTKFKYNK